MTFIPSEADAEAGFTEFLTAVAVHHREGEPRADVPWADVGSAGFYPIGAERWLIKEVSDWENGLEYVLYLVPSAEYRPLWELGIREPKELDCRDFPATPEQVAAVRAAMAN